MYIQRNWRGGIIIRIIIAGSRDFKDYEKLKEFSIDAIESILKEKKLEEYDITIVSGGAKGADSLGEKFAKEYDLKLKIFKADWNNIDVDGAVVKSNKYGKYNAVAGHMRNEKMAEYASQEIGMLIAFWDGKSTGTKNMIGLAEKYGLEVKVCKH